MGLPVNHSISIAHPGEGTFGACEGWGGRITGKCVLHAGRFVP